jgi:hypothetical protein
MPDISGNHINFEEWSALAMSDPEKFEQMRQDKIAAFIKNTTPERQKRLQGLQWQIDRVREQHKNSSIAAYLSISKLMWNTFAELSELLQYQAGNKVPLIPVQKSAKIISFSLKVKN